MTRIFQTSAWLVAARFLINVRLYVRGTLVAFSNVIWVSLSAIVKDYWFPDVRGNPDEFLRGKRKMNFLIISTFFSNFDYQNFMFCKNCTRWHTEKGSPNKAPYTKNCWIFLIKVSFYAEKFVCGIIWTMFLPISIVQIIWSSLLKHPWQECPIFNFWDFSKWLIFSKLVSLPR